MDRDGTTDTRAPSDAVNSHCHGSEFISFREILLVVGANPGDWLFSVFFFGLWTLLAILDRRDLHCFGTSNLVTSADLNLLFVST